MKRETIVWQAIVLILGLVLIFVIRTYLNNIVLIQAMKIEEETMTQRANCFAMTQEKSLNDSYCNNIDTTAYRFFENTKY